MNEKPDKPNVDISHVEDDNFKSKLHGLINS